MKKTSPIPSFIVALSVLLFGIASNAQSETVMNVCLTLAIIIGAPALFVVLYNSYKQTNGD